MPELDDRLSEGRKVVAAMDPPEDLWARVVLRANDGRAPVRTLIRAQHRQRRTTWIAVAAVAAAAALLGAVWVGLDDHQTVDTTPVTEVPAPPVSGDQAMAEAALITSNDIPTGWKAATSTGDQANAWSDDLDRTVADCLGIDAPDLRHDGATAASSFVSSNAENDEPIVSEVTVFASNADAGGFTDRFRDDAALQCWRSAIEQHVAHTASDGITTISGDRISRDHITTGSSTIEPSRYFVNYDNGYFSELGADSVAYRVTVPLTYEGRETDVFVDFAVVRAGRAVVQTFFQSYFTPPFSGADRTDGLQPVLLTNLVLDRIREGLSTSSRQ
jgi:hypothetical protein